MSVTEEARVCRGCGEPLPPNKAPGRPRQWCSERCRKHTVYSGECVDCGATTYSGTVPPSERCVACNGRAHIVWTDEAIIAAIQRWTRIHGEPPRAPQWLKSVEHRGSSYPSVATIQDVFGTWNAAIRMAGLTPRPQGCFGRDGEDMELCREIRARYEAGESTTRLGRVYGCSSKAIAYRVQKAGGRVRTQTEAWQVRRERVAA